MTAIYGQGKRLVAVAIHAVDGPLVRLGEVALIGRVPSEARSDIEDRARREGAGVRVNWSGDPEVAAWGVSMGAMTEWELSSEGYAGRTDRMITDALFVGPELAEDPYGAEPVIRWRDGRRWETDPAAWPVRDDRERPRWDWTPLAKVGPLWFGMSPQQVAAALDGESPAAGRRGWQYLGSERFDRAGVTAHYLYPTDVPALAAVTVHGRTGPQVAFAGTRLIGRPLSCVEATLTRYVEEHGMRLLYSSSGDLGSDEIGLYVRATRAGDTVVSEARFCAPGWED
ncbi:hypothetical protein ACH4S8_43510 [Streptomyces sp. NPDC021080]|uniref:hypothetical protein n=1 Tax=Streptomyces sp. NPDC021080 TaxID=3365110 RepID=UPI0037980A08